MSRRTALPAGFSLTEELLIAARALPAAPHLYFELAGAAMLPLASLRPTRARPAGIASAVVKMDEARLGLRPKRAPIDVRPRPDGSYDVVDGNSTTWIALAAGWPDLPCRILDGTT